MRVTQFVLFVLITFAYGVYKENTVIDDRLKEIIRTEYGGDPSVLNQLVDKKGFPRSLNTPNQTVPSFCLNIVDKVVTSESYSVCTVLSSLNGTVIDIFGWSKFNVFKFSVNLVELRNVELRLEHQQELTYLYFSSFNKCENCLFHLAKNPSLVGVRFIQLHTNASSVPLQLRPRIFLRGNSRLKLDKKKIDVLKQSCNPDLCNIQESEECYFQFSIRDEDEYRRCRHVYGDMVFTDRFQMVQPLETDFWIEGCFHFDRTGIRSVRGFLRAFVNCSKQHVFYDNKFMCTDHIEELKVHWGADKIKVISNRTAVNCYQGECRGGFVAQKNEHLFSACEIIEGNLYISEKSGNLSRRISDLSSIHEIRGQFQLVDNPTITTLALPFLKKIEASKCPALSIQNMENLRNIIFHPHVTFDCKGPGPKVLIRNSPKVYLHKQMLKKMKVQEYVFEYFDYDISHYHFDTITIYLIISSMLLVMIVEIIAAARRNLLFPNFLYRRFPLDVKHRPRQKHSQKKKTE